MTSRPAARAGRRAFVDSGAFFALLNDRDRHHDEARRIVDRVVAERVGLLTSTFVVAEAHALILSRHSRNAAAQFLRGMDESAIPVVRARPSDESRARQIIFQYEDKQFSLTDAISFAVMERYGIDVAFTFDRNFSQYGFRPLTA